MIRRSRTIFLHRNLKSCLNFLTGFTFLIFSNLLYAFDEDEFIDLFLWNEFLSNKNIKIALVLGGGGARGFAHIGVIKVIQQEKIPIDFIVGTSIGSIIGGLYSSGVSISKLEKLAEEVGWDKLVDITKGGLPKLIAAKSFLSTKKMEKYLSTNLKANNFADLKIKFASVAADIITGERIIFKEGDLALAMRASSNIPGIFEPVEFRHRFLVDGGIVDNLPVDIAKILGADFVIAVDVRGEFSRDLGKNVISILTQSIAIQGSEITKNKIKDADFLIKPNVGQISIIELWQSKKCIREGIIATQSVIQDIKLLILKKWFQKYLSILYQ